MLHIEPSEVEAIRNKMIERYVTYMNKLALMRNEIAAEKKVLINLKAQKKNSDVSSKSYVSDLIDTQRERIKKLEANYSNAYNTQPVSSIVPVYVQTDNGCILMNWTFMQKVLNKLKGMVVQYFIQTSNGPKTLSVAYRTFDGKTHGVYELNPLGYDLERELYEIIPTAYTEWHPTL